MYYYVGTGYRASGTSGSISVRPTDSVNENLLVVQYFDSLKFYQISIDLSLHIAYSYDRFELFELLVKLPLPSSDYVLALTKENEGYLLVPSKDSVATLAKWKFNLDFGKKPDIGPTGFCTRNTKCVVLNLYKGVLHILPMDSIEFMNAFTVWIKHEDVLDIADLSSTEETLIGILYKTHNGIKLVVYELSLERKEIFPPKPLWKLLLSDPNVHKAIALNPSTLLFISVDKVYFYHTFKGTPLFTLPLPEPAIVLCSTVVDPLTLLIGTSKRRLYKLSVTENSLKICLLGDIPYPSGLSCVAPNLVYVCSLVSNSALYSINQRGTIELLSEHNNLGCIEDFCIPNADNNKILACCNHLEYSELNVLGKGLSLQKLLAVPMCAVHDIWTVGEFMAVGLINETKLFRFVDKTSTLAETIEDNFNHKCRTLLVGKLGPFIAQITDEEARVYSANFAVVHRIIPNVLPVLHGAASPCGEKIAICENNNSVHVYGFAEDKIMEVFNGSFGEVSAVAVTFNRIAVATWDNLLHVCSFKGESKDLLRTEGMLVRSMEFAVDSGKELLLCGTSDGYLAAYGFTTPEQRLYLESYTVIGAKEVKVRPFPLYNTPAFVALSDTPIFITHNATEYHPFLECNKEIVSVALWKLGTSPVVISADCDELSVHAANLPLNRKVIAKQLPKMQARKIACDNLSNVIYVLGERKSECDELLAFCGNTYELIDIQKFPAGEMAFSVFPMKTLIMGATENVVLVGVATEFGTKEGKILSFVIRNRRLHLISQTHTKGAVLALTQYKAAILGTVNAGISLYQTSSEIDSTGKILAFMLYRISFAESIRCALLTFIEIRGDLIIAGDIGTFINVFVVNKNEIKEVEIHSKPFWSHCGVFVNESNVLLATEKKLYSARLCKEQNRLKITGIFDLKQKVTKLQKGTFVNKRIKEAFQLKAGVDKQVSVKNKIFTLMPEDGLETIIYSTAFGSIGTVISIPEDSFKILHKLEEVMRKEKEIAGECDSFIDGDLVEKFLKLPLENKQKMYGKVEGPKPELSDILIFIKQLMLLHQLQQYSLLLVLILWIILIERKEVCLVRLNFDSSEEDTGIDHFHHRMTFPGISALSHGFLLLNLLVIERNTTILKPNFGRISLSSSQLSSIEHSECISVQWYNNGPIYCFTISYVPKFIQTPPSFKMREITSMYWRMLLAVSIKKQVMMLSQDSIENKQTKYNWSVLRKPPQIRQQSQRSLKQVSTGQRERRLALLPLQKVVIL
eukprot:TRINITY_DN4440_c0_g1_i1.p1 TRINITY_DN4440_c0_g1~~TRINITY_DN4440_c0_g1_i1.p1  ORF type:complete len:1275 (+),score=108.07 TRINITY_DN4440_c0_g1_i1:67-3825(+)